MVRTEKDDRTEDCGDRKSNKENTWIDSAIPSPLTPSKDQDGRDVNPKNRPVGDREKPTPKLSDLTTRPRENLA